MKLIRYLPLAGVFLAVLSLGAGPAHADDERPWPVRSTVVDSQPAFTGSDNDGAESETALGPQYRVDANVVIGGTSEKADLSATTTNPDADHYTFGLRVAF